MSGHLHAVHGERKAPVTYSAEFLVRLEQQARLCVGDRFQDPPLILVSESGGNFASRSFRVVRNVMTDTTVPGQPVIVFEADAVGASRQALDLGWRPS